MVTNPLHHWKIGTHEKNQGWDGSTMNLCDGRGQLLLLCQEYIDVAYSIWSSHWQTHQSQTVIGIYTPAEVREKRTQFFYEQFFRYVTFIHVFDCNIVYALGYLEDSVPSPGVIILGWCWFLLNHIRLVISLFSVGNMFQSLVSFSAKYGFMVVQKQRLAEQSVISIIVLCCLVMTY